MTEPHPKNHPLAGLLFSAGRFSTFVAAVAVVLPGWLVFVGLQPLAEVLAELGAARLLLLVPIAVVHFVFLNRSRAPLSRRERSWKNWGEAHGATRRERSSITLAGEVTARGGLSGKLEGYPFQLDRVVSGRHGQGVSRLRVTLGRRERLQFITQPRNALTDIAQFGGLKDMMRKSLREQARKRGLPDQAADWILDGDVGDVPGGFHAAHVVKSDVPHQARSFFGDEEVRQALEALDRAGSWKSWTLYDQDPRGETVELTLELPGTATEASHLDAAWAAQAAGVRALERLEITRARAA